jgi:hypothetical protein
MTQAHCKSTFPFLLRHVLKGTDFKSRNAYLECIGTLEGISLRDLHFNDRRLKSNRSVLIVAIGCYCR